MLMQSIIPAEEATMTRTPARGESILSQIYSVKEILKRANTPLQAFILLCMSLSRTFNSKVRAQ